MKLEMKKALGLVACLLMISCLFFQKAEAKTKILLDMSFDKNVTDSANDEKGTKFGDIKFGKGISKKAIYLDGDGDYVSLGEGYNLPKSFTLNVWVKTDEENVDRSDAAILAKYETNKYGPYDFYLAYNKPAYWVSDGTGGGFFSGGYEAHISETVLKANKWYMLTYTYDNKKTQLSIYINGKLDSTFNCIPVTTNKDEVTIGRQSLHFNGNHQEFKGWIDELRIYNKALSAKKIKKLYRSYKKK